MPLCDSKLPTLLLWDNEVHWLYNELLSIVYHAHFVCKSTLILVSYKTYYTLTVVPEVFDVDLGEVIMGMKGSFFT